MPAVRVRSFTLLALTIFTTLIASLAIGAPAQAAAKKAKPKCTPAQVAKLKAAADRRARKITRSAARRKATRASLLAAALKRSGCSARKVVTVTTKTTTTTTTTSSAPKTTPGAANKTSPSAPTKTADQAPSAPAPTPTTSQSWWTGMQGGANAWDARVGQKLGAKIVRVEFEIGTPVSSMRSFIADYADRGIRVLPLAGFWGRIPSQSEARSLAAWAREFGPGGSFWASRPAQASLAIRQIEFGNETSFAYQGTQKRGGEYAQRVRDAAEALAGTQVGLLVQADNANQSDNWIGQMFSAVPNLADYVAGWTVHPYGPKSKWQNRIDEVLTRTAGYGAPSSIPVDITEWGLSTDNGRCLNDNYGWDKCMTYQQAGDALTSTVADMKARYGGRIRHFLIYNGRDLRGAGTSSDRENYFGLTTLDEQDKGGFTAAAKAVLAG